MANEAAKQEIATWLAERWAESLAQVVESMTGSRPSVEEQKEGPDFTAGEALRWAQEASHASGAKLGVFFPETAWQAVGQGALAAVGIEDSDADSIRGTALEIFGQSLSTVARAIAERIGKEVSLAAGAAIETLDGPVSHFSIEFNGEKHPHSFGVSAALVESMLPAEQPMAQAAAAGAGSRSPAAIPSEADGYMSRTLDLLLDVELPVSISFGRAHIPLKEVLKLTSGSIVELNRAVSDPVEVIVNNCVVARGEVVVVDGNYGIRVQEIVSRQERLRTLN